MDQEHENDSISKVKPDQDSKNNFCIPNHCCPERFPSPQLPSPADCLPPEVLEEVREKIRDANELLLDLALADSRSPEETFQKVFDGLIGLRVEIITQLGETNKGLVTLSGFDFVVLRDEEVITILPYREIELVKPEGRFAEFYHDIELSEIAPCFRRDLTFHFGEVVSSSPALIHLFFRIRLAVYLLIVEAKQMQVSVGGLLVEGLLLDVNKETIVLKVEGEKRAIAIDKISHITFKR